jgi:enoyl-CoA hydratase/carnithine racemase
MLRYEVEPPRATITLDDPKRRNPLPATAMVDLATMVGQAADDDSVRVVVVTGAGDRVFSAGGDLAGGFVDEPKHVDATAGALATVFRTMRSAGKPIVARVNGHALAGGFGLVAACDIVVATDRARFGLPEINVGLWPMMITAVLQRCMPHKVLLELMMTGRSIDAREARDLGVVSRVVSPEDLDGVIDECVAELTAKSPIALKLGKDAFYAVEDLELGGAFDVLQEGLARVATTDDAAEGIAAFLEKRGPRWTGK